MPTFEKSEADVSANTSETVMSPARGRGSRRGRDKEKNPGLSIFWGISGGSVVGAMGFVLLTLYQQYDNSVTELERDLKHFNIACAELVKKDEISNRFKTFWEAIAKLDKSQSEKGEKITFLEHQLKADEDERKELTREVQRLRERMATIEGRQSVTAPPRLAVDAE